MEKIGRVEHVVVSGKQIVREDEYIGECGEGVMVRGDGFGLLDQE